MAFNLLAMASNLLAMASNLLHRPAEVKAISETTPVPHETPRIQEVKQVNAKTCRSPSGRSDKTMFVSIV